MKRLALILAALLAGVPLVLLTAQDAPTMRVTGVNATNLPTTLITTTVIDSTGRSVPDLTAADFELSGAFGEVGTIVSVESTADESVSFAVVLVIDTSSSMADTPLRSAQAAARLFVEGLGPNDPVAVVAFSSTARVVQDFSTDKAAVNAAIDALRFGGQTALYEAVLLGVETAAQAPVDRRAVVVLSDGYQFGISTAANQNTALELAQIEGVSIYTIGLGYGTDRPYLERLAESTNATYSESPTPEQLSEIYTGLASLFRNQYIVTVNADVPLDGTEYPFTLRANTPFGTTNPVEGIVRAPVPVPVLRLPDLTDAIAEVTTITPVVLADQTIASLTATLNDEPLTVTDGAVTIDPVDLLPGSYTLAFTATDSDGDSGSVSGDIAIAALPSDVTVTLNPDNVVVSTPVEFTVTGEGQTPLTRVLYTLDGTVFESEDADNNFAADFDPFNITSGEQTLVVSATNAGGVTTEVELPLLIAPIAPTVTVEGVSEGLEVSEPVTISATATLQQGAEAGETTLTINGETVELPFTLDPANFPPGPLTLTITTTDSNGQTTTQTIQIIIPNLGVTATADAGFTGEVTDPTEVPIVVDTQTEITNVTVEINGRSFTVTPEGNVIPLLIDPEAIGANGTFTAVVTITNANGDTTTIEVPFTVSGLATPTPAPSITPEAATPVAGAEATQDVVVAPTDEVPASETSVATEVAATPESTVTSVPPSETPEPTQAVVEATTVATEPVVAVVSTETLVPSTNTTVPPTNTATQVPPTNTITPDANATATTMAGATATRVEFLNRAAGTATAQVEVAQTATQGAVEQATQNAAVTQTASVARATTVARVVTSTAEAAASATANAMATANAESTRDAAATVTAELDATQTAQFQPSETAIPPTLETTPEVTIEATEDANPTEVALATLTPVPGLQPGGDQPPPPQIDVVPYVVCGGAALLLVLLLFLLSRTRREDQ